MALSRVISAEGNGFEPLTKPSKSYPNRKNVNWSRHVK